MQNYAESESLAIFDMSQGHPEIIVMAMDEKRREFRWKCMTETDRKLSLVEIFYNFFCQFPNLFLVSSGKVSPGIGNWQGCPE